MQLTRRIVHIKTKTTSETKTKTKTKTRAGTETHLKSKVGHPSLLQAIFVCSSLGGALVSLLVLAGTPWDNENFMRGKY